MAEPSTDRIGQRFGSYEITRFLGRGGFADVFLGRNVNLPAQEVAIKVLDKIMIRYDKADQFKKEAAIILTLRHPSIVQFYNYDVYLNPAMTDTAYPYIVMEYASNGSLRSNHPRGVPLPLETIVVYLQQIASALQYAHGNQVMHLDVKPENILVSRQGKVLLSDFGLATVITEQRRSNDIQGTLSYMAPEQFEGRPDKASDQYSLAVMVYEWICGSVPFIGRSIQDHVEKLLHEPPPSLTAKSRALNPVIEAVVMRALAKNARDRYASVLQFAEQLEKAIKDPWQISPSPNNPVIVTPTPTPTPQMKPVRPLKSPIPPPAPVQIQVPHKQPAVDPGRPNQPEVAIAPQRPPVMPFLQPVAQEPATNKKSPDASPEPAPVDPAVPALNPVVNQPPVSPDAQNADGEAPANPVAAAPQRTPFYFNPPPRVQEANEPDPQSPPLVVGVAQLPPAANVPDPEQAPWVVAQGGIGGQGGVHSIQTISPFLDGRPQKAQVTPSQQSYAGEAGLANPTRPFLGYTSPADQQQNDPGQLRFGPIPEPPQHTYSQTIRAFNVMDEPAPPAIPPYLGRPGNGGALNEPEEKSVGDFLNQTMQDLLQPRRGRRRASPLFAIFIAASVIGAIYFAVWLGRVLPSTGNEIAWMGLILTFISSLGTFWLFDYAGSGLVKVVAATLLAIDWGLFGYGFAAVIGGGTHIGILPDPSIMAVILLFITLGLCLWKMYQHR